MRHGDPFGLARVMSIKNQVKDEWDALECLKNNEKKSKKRNLTKDVETNFSDTIKNKKIKTMIDFDKNEYNSIKSIVIKENTTIEVTSRFIKEKMLMLSKVSIRSIMYDLIDVFCFPDETVKEIYCQNSIIKFNLYLNLTDTNPCSILFVKKNVRNPEKLFNISKILIFEILKQSKFAKIYFFSFTYLFHKHKYNFTNTSYNFKQKHVCR